MKLFFKTNLLGEIAHYYDIVTKDIIISKANKFYVTINKFEHIIKLPLSSIFLFVLSKFRLTRRLFRIDKSNAIFNFKKDGVIIIYLKKIYFYDLVKKKLFVAGNLINSRNILHNGIAVSKKGIFFGEYGSNKNKKRVPIWGSYDDGRNWKIIYNFPRNSIKHVHGIYNDPYEDNLWITTGDANSECFLFKVKKKNFNNIIKYGDGSQKWRAVSLFFKKKFVIWVMDSPLQTSTLQIFDRKKETIKKGCVFPGPVWYSKTFLDQTGMLQTSVEIGKAVKSKYSSLFYSKNLINWREIYKFQKDMFPKKLFKFGVIAFSEGRQTSKDFMFSAEALKKIDGKVFIGKITK